MAKIDFKMIITDQGVTYARQAVDNPGWYLKPKRWEITDIRGELSLSRTFADRSKSWVNLPFSGLIPEGDNRLLHSIVIPPDATTLETVIGEIYFIYEDYYGNEFLYAIAQPVSDTPVYYTPGVSQSYYFAFTLTNATVADTFTINYTYPQDIEDHNNKIDVHSNLLKRDGSRTANGILSYATDLEFINDFDIINKKYVQNSDKILRQEICPAGTLMWYSAKKAPDGWLVRDGAEYPISVYSDLYSVIGDTFSQDVPTREGYFRVPDDRGLFIRGWNDRDTGIDANRLFGSYQEDGIPNIKGQIGGLSYDKNDSKIGMTGAFYWGDVKKYGAGQGENDRYGYFDASRSNDICKRVYKDLATEITVKNRAYLPIIKY